MKKIIRKWYEKIGFPEKYNPEFEKILETETLFEETIDEYNIECKNGRKNFLMFLYFLEDLEKKYREKGIPEEIFLATARDMVYWTNVWSDIKGELWQEEILWLKFHLSFRLFTLGRVQFCMSRFKKDYPEYGIKAGDGVVDIHIPAMGPLDISECEKSIKAAGEFFEKYFPEFKYKFYSCNSWLLDETLSEFLKADSNILKFQKLFKIIETQKSYGLLGFVFKWDTRIENLRNYEATSNSHKR